jgi:hypothetical protein
VERQWPSHQRAQLLWARHPDDAVLGTDRRGLESDGVEHLRKSQREHDEIHAAHANA